MDYEDSNKQQLSSNHQQPADVSKTWCFTWQALVNHPKKGPSSGIFHWLHHHGKQ